MTLKVSAKMTVADAVDERLVDGPFTEALAAGTTAVLYRLMFRPVIAVPAPVEPAVDPDMNVMLSISAWASPGSEYCPNRISRTARREFDGAVTHHKSCGFVVSAVAENG
jgi:hypothetical protein